MAFGWRQALKRRDIEIRCLLVAGEFEVAAALADTLARDAELIGVPRYAVPARLLAARARARMGLAIDHDTIDSDITAMSTACAIEAWWRIADIARDTGVEAWRDRAVAEGLHLAAMCVDGDEHMPRAIEQRCGVVGGRD